MPNISPDETVAIVIAGLVLFAAGFLNEAGRWTWKSVQNRIKKKTTKPR